MLAKWIFVLIVSMTLSGWVWADSPDEEKSQPRARVAAVISNAWVRALPPTQKMTAGYLRLTNTGESALNLVGATSNAAEHVEMHTSIEVDGLTRMQQLKSLPVAAGESIEFIPGSTHLMFMGLRKMPRPGEEVEICLQLASGGEVCTVALAQKAGPKGAGAHKHHH